MTLSLFFLIETYLSWIPLLCVWCLCWPLLLHLFKYNPLRTDLYLLLNHTLARTQGCVVVYICTNGLLHSRAPTHHTSIILGYFRSDVVNCFSSVRYQPTPFTSCNTNDVDSGFWVKGKFKWVSFSFISWCRCIVDLKTRKEFCYLPAKYKNCRACAEGWWTTATASWGHPQSPWYHDLICVCGQVFIAVRTFCSGTWQESDRSSQSRGVMLTEGGCKLLSFLLVRYFGKFKWHLW